MTTPETGIVITLPEIYAEMRAMGKTVGRIDATLTTFVTDSAERESRQDARIDDHEIRIRADEANRWPLPNLVALATVAGSAIALAALAITR